MASFILKWCTLDVGDRLEDVHWGEGGKQQPEGLLASLRYEEAPKN